MTILEEVRLERKEANKNNVPKRTNSDWITSRNNLCSELKDYEDLLAVYSDNEYIAANIIIIQQAIRALNMIMKGLGILRYTNSFNQYTIMAA